MIHRFFLVSGVVCGLWIGVALAEAVEEPVNISPDVVVEYEGIKVTREDLERYITFRVPPERQAEILSSADRLLQIVDQVLVTRILASRAESPDLDQLNWQAEFQRDSWLAQQAQDQAATKKIKEINWEAKAKEAYQAAPEKYRAEARVNASHILLDVKERTSEEALQLAQSLRKRLLAGEDFETLAVEYSDDLSAQTNKGALGTFGTNAMVKPFTEAVFAMREPGSISEPVETEFGWHLIRLNKLHPAGPRPFEQVKNQIIRELHARISAAAKEAAIMDARPKSGAKVHPEVIDSMVRK